MSVNFLTLDILYYDFIESLLVFHQFPWFSGSQTEIPRLSMPGTRIIQFHDFPGFSGPVRTLHEYILQQTPDDTRNIYLDNNFVLRFDTKFTSLIWKNTYGSDKGFITISNKTIRLNQLFLKIYNRSRFFFATRVTEMRGERGRVFRTKTSLRHSIDMRSISQLSSYPWCRLLILLRCVSYHHKHSKVSQPLDKREHWQRCCCKNNQNKKTRK